MSLRFVGAFLAIFLMSCDCDVDPGWMNDTLTNYFSEPRHHVSNPAYKVRAMRYIRDQFRTAGLETHVHTFSTENENVTGVNVIGLLKSKYFNTPDDRVVGIGAHYDTMRVTPGVDDNGAAVVTMLQAAREVSRQPHRNYTVIFIAFDFEEWEPPSKPGAACTQYPYLCGSMSLVKKWIPNFWTEPVGWGGIFVMDTIMNFDSKQQAQTFPTGIDAIFPSQAQSIASDGGRGDFLLAAGRQQDQALLNAFNSTWNKQGSPQFETESFTLPPALTQAYNNNFVRSDHLSFWMAGYNAVFLTDTADFRGYMEQCYHQACDTIGRVTPSMINFAAKTCRTLISLVNSYSPVVNVTSASAKLGPGWLSAVVAVLALLSTSRQLLV